MAKRKVTVVDCDSDRYRISLTGTSGVRVHDARGNRAEMVHGAASAPENLKKRRHADKARLPILKVRRHADSTDIELMSPTDRTAVLCEVTLGDKAQCRISLRIG